MLKNYIHFFKCRIKKNIKKESKILKDNKHQVKLNQQINEKNVNINKITTTIFILE